MPRNDLIQLRSDTAANWVSVNPTLAVGETGFETDTGKLKVGTGSTAWNSLLYVTDASDLTGTIASARISGSYTGITGVGTLTAGTWNSSLIAGQYGGTGVANTGKTITLGGNLTTSGAFTTTLTVTANTSLTLPSSGTVISTANLSSITAVNNSVNIGTLGNITTDAYTVVLSNTNYPTLTTRIGEHYTVSGVGTANNDFTVFSNATVRIKYAANNTIATFNSTGLTVTDTVTATTFIGALSGNASTATNLSTNRTNWSTNGTISATVGQLAWKNYGNNHTIFDASQSTSPSGSAVNNTNAAIAWSGTSPTLMGWNGSNTYGVRVDSARTSDNTTGNAATAGSSSATTFTSSFFQGTYSTLQNDHALQALRSGNGGSAAGVALWVTGIACQFRLGTGEEKVFLQNSANTNPAGFRAIIDNASSVHLKQDIKTFPMLVNAAGSAVNEAEIESGLNIVRQLRPVTYKWKEKLHLSQLPSNPRRALALSRLNKIRSSKGLEPYESDELQHDCSRDDCNGTAENPCSRVKNWENGNIGFIAQEVGALVPQAANLDKDGEYSGIDNVALTAIAVASIKELDATIQALTARIKQLEESNV